MPYKPVVLIVLDGVGVSTVAGETPFSVATLPTFREMEQFFPFTTLRASGIAVGLPWGEEGNSEVGHLTMGAGKVFYHHLPRIETAIHDESFFTNDAFVGAAAHVKEHNSTLHLMGLFSSGSVHAYVDHLYALLEFAKRAEVAQVMVHLFTDGRDAPREEAAKFLGQLVERMRAEYPFAQLASVMGRFFAMDRDGRWERTEKAYNLLVTGAGHAFSDARAYIENSYASGITDEFIEPGYLTDADGAPVGRLQGGDAVVYYDFREDSTRQLTAAFVGESFDHFSREKVPNLFFVTMTAYDEAFTAAHVAFPPLKILWPLARVIAEARRTQLHVAETEKYAHVTYFFNGGTEKAYAGEERVLIPSLQQTRFEENPAMAAAGVAGAVIAGVEKFDFILANFANGDMVGHTGDFDATARALEVLDRELQRIIPVTLAAGGAVIVTADHGNVEEKRYHVTGEPRTKHTANPVPFYLVAERLRRIKPRAAEEVERIYSDIGGVLTDVAPTVLGLMGIEKPGEMTGISLVQRLRSEK